MEARGQRDDAVEAAVVPIVAMLVQPAARDGVLVADLRKGGGGG